MSGPQAGSIVAVLRNRAACRLSEEYLGPQKHLLTLLSEKFMCWAPFVRNVSAATCPLLCMTIVAIDVRFRNSHCGCMASDPPARRSEDQVVVIAYPLWVKSGQAIPSQHSALSALGH